MDSRPLRAQLRDHDMLLRRHVAPEWRKFLLIRRLAFAIGLVLNSVRAALRVAPERENFGFRIDSSLGASAAG